MFGKTAWRSLKIAATRNQGFKRKVLIFVASAATLSIAAATVTFWLGYQLMTEASTQIRTNLSAIERVDVRSCLAAVAELSSPGYWLDTTLEKTIDETLAHCRKEGTEGCQGDACLDIGRREIETKV